MLSQQHLNVSQTLTPTDKKIWNVTLKLLYSRKLTHVNNLALCVEIYNAQGIQLSWISLLSGYTKSNVQFIAIYNNILY